MPKSAGAMGPDTREMVKNTTDELSMHYAAVAEDGKKAGKQREAAMFFTVAEQHLEDNDDYQECLKSAEEALKTFKEMGDMKGSADSVRLVIHAKRRKADCLANANDSKLAEETL